MRQPGVTHPGLLDPPNHTHGTSRLDTWTDWGAAYHDLVMPGLVKWFRHLAARLRHVRVLNGDWSRAVTSGVTRTLAVRQGGTAGLFLDPPYGLAVRAKGLYQTDSDGLAARVCEWAATRGDDPQCRIVLAGFDNENHAATLIDKGWTEHEWFTPGFMAGGMASMGGGNQQHRERLWASPHCLAAAHEQPSLFDTPAYPTEDDE